MTKIDLFFSKEKNVRYFIALILLYLMRFTLWFRYRVTIKGVENLNDNTLAKPGGILFLPNHPTVFVDPTLVTLAIWKKYPIRPMIVEYMYYTPIVHAFMKFMNALPVPNFVSSSNSLKKRKVDEAMEAVISGLKSKENFLIYPAGKVKHQAREIIGASGVHRIIQAVPEANVVLVRTTGLWGSSFSRATIIGSGWRPRWSRAKCRSTSTMPTANCASSRLIWPVCPKGWPLSITPLRQVLSLVI